MRRGPLPPGQQPAARGNLPARTGAARRGDAARCRFAPFPAGTTRRSDLYTGVRLQLRRVEPRAGGGALARAWDVGHGQPVLPVRLVTAGGGARTRGGGAQSGGGARGAGTRAGSAGGRDSSSFSGAGAAWGRGCCAVPAATGRRTGDVPVRGVRVPAGIQAAAGGARSLRGPASGEPADGAAGGGRICLDGPGTRGGTTHGRGRRGPVEVSRGA